jgi:hypothetical protein
MKSYSEVYRMLGWLRPGGRRLEFSTTLLGAQVAIDFAAQKSLAYGLIRECLMAVCFPNPLTEIIGVLNHRPFSWLLKLCNALEGVISRHEIIIGLLAVTDDSASGAFTAAVGRIKNVRGKKRTQLIKAANRCARDAEVKLNSLENYTRLPVAILKSSEIGWGTSERLSDLYMEPLEVLKLSDLGVKDAEWVLRAVDIREAQLEKFPIDVRAHFANFAHYSMLVRAGLGISEIESELTSARLGCGELLAHFGISDPFDFIYSPLQQSSDEVISRAEELG